MDNFFLEYKKLGLNIKKQREAKKLTQEQLAEKVDLSLDYIGKIEVAINHPGLKTVFKIAKALKVKPSVFFEF